MAKDIKKFDDFLNEMYYETSSTVVPGAGVNPGTFAGHAGTQFFTTSDPKNIQEEKKIEEADVPQEGPHGITQDPDYVPPSQNTHATWQGQIQLGDVVEDIDPKCKFKGSFGKAIGIIGSGDKAQVQYLIANEGEGWGIGEVAKIAATSLKTVKKHQMNG